MKRVLYTLMTAGAVALAGVSAAWALSLKGVVAYPVPFNPDKHAGMFQIGTPGGPGVPATTKVKIEIYDINGDDVFTREYSSFPAYWNGRNGAGRKVKPGMYIIKVTAEDDISGGYERKVIRILVDY